MKSIINEMKELAIDLEMAKLAGDDYDVWCILNMIEIRQEHLQDIFCGRC